MEPLTEDCLFFEKYPMILNYIYFILFHFEIISPATKKRGRGLRLYTPPSNYNYLQLLCREIIEYLLYRGFPRPIWPAKDHERGEGSFAVQIGQGNPKKLLYTILSFFGIPSKRWLKIRNSIIKNPRNF